VTLTPAKILLKCDQLKHDERWILTPSQAQQLLRLESTSTSYTDKEKVNVSEVTLEPVHLDSNAKKAYDAPRLATRSSVFRSCLGSLLRSPASTRTSSRDHQCCAVHPPNPPSSPLILDLRNKAAFRAQHIPGSVNTPLEVLTPDLADGDLFGDPEAVFKVWNPMQTLFAGREMTKLLEDTKQGRRAVVVVCYDGDASRLATAMLRDRGLEALSVQGGLAGFVQ
jgi:rhodanese-related sulfurtransferase